MTLLVDWEFEEDWGVSGWGEVIVLRIAVEPDPDADGTAEGEPHISTRVMSLGGAALEDSIALFGAADSDDSNTWRTSSVEVRPGPVLPSRIRFSTQHAKLGREKHERCVWIIPRVSVALSVAAVGVFGVLAFLRSSFLLRTLQFTAADLGVGMGGALVAFIAFWMKSLTTRARASGALPDFGIGLMLGRTLVFLLALGAGLDGLVSYTSRNWLVAFDNQTGAPIDFPHSLEGTLALPPARGVTLTEGAGDLVCGGKSEARCSDLVGIMKRVPDATTRYCFSAGLISDTDRRNQPRSSEWWRPLPPGQSGREDGPVEQCTRAKPLIDTGPASDTTRPLLAVDQASVAIACREQLWTELSALKDDPGGSWNLPKPAFSAKDRALGGAAAPKEHSGHLYPCDEDLCWRLGAGCTKPTGGTAWVVRGGVRRLIRQGAEEEAAAFTATLDTHPNARLGRTELWVSNRETGQVTHRFAAFSQANPIEMKVPAAPTFFAVDLVNVDPPVATDRIPPERSLGRLRCTGGSADYDIGKFAVVPVPFRDPKRGLLRLAAFRSGQGWASVWKDGIGRRDEGTAFFCERATYAIDHIAVIVSRTARQKGVALMLPSSQGRKDGLTVHIYRETSDPDAPQPIGTADCAISDASEEPILILPIDDSDDLDSLKVQGAYWWKRLGPGLAYACVRAGPPTEVSGTAKEGGASRRADIVFARNDDGPHADAGSVWNEITDIVLARSEDKPGADAVSVWNEIANIVIARLEGKPRADEVSVWNEINTKVTVTKRDKLCWLPKSGGVRRGKPEEEGCVRLTGTALAEFRRVNSTWTCDEVHAC